MNTRKRILVVGGVAGGASCAARARRLSEDAEIIVFERGPYVSFANCGLPYYVGDVIQKEDKLLVATAELFKTRFNIDVRTESEVVAIDRERREIQVRNLRTGASYREQYDALVLAPGAAPLRPPLPGIDLPGIFTLRTIPDSRDIRQWIAVGGAQTAVVVGAGFIGLEMTENLVQRGLTVTVIEMMDQVLPPLDPELAEAVRQRLVDKGVSVHLNDAVAAFERESSGQLVVTTRSGVCIRTDLVVLGLGVRPEIKLAKQAGLVIGEKNGIRVDESMRTSDPHIWAVGDAVESRDFVTGEWCVVPLAGPANRQGRIAADSICGRRVHFRGVQSTAVCGVFGLTVAMTGASEKALKRSGIADYDKVYLHPNDHAAYYPGAKPIHLKLLFSCGDGRVLGAQAVGEEGVEKRIDVIAMAIQKGATIHDLEEAELCYAPQFGTAKDPVNFAGMVASNVLHGDVSLARWEQVPDTQALLLDVREPSEFKDGHVEGALNIPLPQLRARLGELPGGREIWVYCAAGQRSYYALRILRQHGYSCVRNLSGGFTSYKQFQPMLHKAQAAVGGRE
ncbi:MAG: FAD-dependent oxidoreductase [Candidatus Korobacteraceae bacterium]|jgi:NADPH-dependent 2,4-dienoyl-CoA reductase/sulfur reductase-like enzyme/rhodanese-related sulfurtransferase